jgi:hypothetical protein
VPAVVAAAAGRASAGSQPIPNNELALASDLYVSLQEFYRTHKQYKDRPLYITGEVRGGRVTHQQPWIMRTCGCPLCQLLCNSYGPTILLLLLCLALLPLLPLLLLLP